MKHWLVAGLLAVSTWAGAAEERLNVANFDTQVSREVENDTAYATLFVEFSELDPARLANRVNQALTSGVKAARANGAMQAIRTHYTTYPLYGKNNQAQGWRGRGELKLTARDFAALSRLIGDLSTSMQLAEIRYGLSDETRKQVEEKLLDEGMQAFRVRAAQLQKGMGGKGWKLLNVQVSTRAQGARPLEMNPGLARAMAAPAPAPVEGGDSRLELSLRGSIQILE